MKKSSITLKDISRFPENELSPLRQDHMPALPPPYDRIESEKPFKTSSIEQKDRISFDLDGISALSLPRILPGDFKVIRRKFISGLKKLLKKESNWTFLQPLMLSLDYCARCQTCSGACPVFESSGRNEIYRPTYRTEIFRRLIRQYARPHGRMLSFLTGGKTDLNPAMLKRLYELIYRCTLCRRCAQSCPMGLDNALLTRELRKLFSQELGWAPKELHEKGTQLQLSVGSSTGMKPRVVRDNIQFIDEDMSEATGIKVETPWDIEGADILLIHNAGEILSWPDNPAAFAIILNAAGISWTLSSEMPAYDGVNYGLFYDDVQLAKIAVRHMEAAKKLGVKKIVMGECGHEHKALITIADRLLPGHLRIPRVSALPLLEEIVFSGKIQFDPAKNNFPVTLHDPCNIVRNLGITEPQRRILRYLCPQFREMTPHGTDNYCCGGGSGFAIMSQNNFTDWRVRVAGRRKLRQILNAFADCAGPEIHKYICAPCSNCKGQIRDIFNYYGVREHSGIIYGGIAELIVNAMTVIEPPYVRWDS